MTLVGQELKYSLTAENAAEESFADVICLYICHFYKLIFTHILIISDMHPHRILLPW